MKKLFKIVHKRHKIESTAIECVTKSVITASTYYFSSKHQHYQAMNDIKMVTHSVLKYPESCKLILSQHIFSGVERSVLKSDITANVLVNSKTAHPPRANPGAFDLFEKFWSNSPLCCRFHGRMPHPLKLQRGSNQPPCHAMHS